MNCWHVTPQRRPTFDELADMLKQMVDDEKVSSLLIYNILPYAYLSKVKDALPHPFEVSLSNPRTMSHKSSFISRTCNL